MSDQVIVVGAGLAGLCCARHLAAANVPVVVLEASDEVGGRVRTDRVEGFRLDRGFQVLLTAYPEAQAMLDYDALDLKPFRAGALVRRGGKFRRMCDPARHPTELFSTLFSGIGTFADRYRTLRMRRRGPRDSSGTTLETLRAEGFSDDMIEGFFRPMFAGVTLDPSLGAPGSFFAFTFDMFGRGDTVLPAAGMGAIPKQLAGGLDIRLQTHVRAVTPKAVELQSGQRMNARAVVVAVEAPAAAKLFGRPAPAGRDVTCFYFAADAPPLPDALLVLNADGHGPINDLTVISNVAPSYAPSGKALVCVNVLGRGGNGVQAQLRDWFGPQADGWRLLRNYEIRHALPAGAVQAPDGIHACGDYLDAPSMQGAMASGRSVAEEILR